MDVSFDAITSLIGSTGVGKSTVLRTLDWFFNGDKGGGIEEGDVHSAAEGKRVRVEVEFGGLTASALARRATGFQRSGRRIVPRQGSLDASGTLTSAKVTRARPARILFRSRSARSRALSALTLASASALSRSARVA